jgi:hypothetical protein
MFRTWLCIVSVLVTLYYGVTSAQSNLDDEELLIAKASRSFERNEYDEALPLYSQIVSNYPHDPMYNYRLGVCMLKAGSDKAGAVRFLRTAAQSTHIPINAWMYLGMALHHAAKYEEAVAAFETFRDGAGKQPWREMEGDKWLGMSRSAIAAQAQPVAVQGHSIMETFQAPRSEFFKPYAAMTSYGKFLAMPEEYNRFIIKGRPESSWVFLGSDGKTMLFSGKGSKGSDFDIFIVRRKNSTQWTTPEEVTAINTPDDDAFPVISQDGKSIFFSSKGHGSTGGYDIFTSSFNPATLTWSVPVSMGSQVNSAGDDFGYVLSKDGKDAFFASDRESAPGQCQVFRARIRNNDEGVVHVTGTFVCTQALENSEARITIMRQSDRSLVGELRQAAAFSAYTMDIASGSRLIYKIDLPGFRISEQEVDFGPFEGGTVMEVIAVSRGKEGEDKAIISHMRPNAEEDNVTATIPQQLPVNGQLAEHKPDHTAKEEKSETAVQQQKPGEQVATNKLPQEQGQDKAGEVQAQNDGIQITRKHDSVTVEQHTPATASAAQGDPLISSEFPATPSISTNEGQSKRPVNGDKETEQQASGSTNEGTQLIDKSAQNASGAIQKQRSAEPVAEVLPVALHGPVSIEQVTTKHSSTGNEQEEPRTSGTDQVPVKKMKEQTVPETAAEFGDVTFRVQVGAYRDKTPDQLTKKFSPTGLKDLVYVKNDQGIWLVMTGSTKDYTEAVRLKESVKSKGVADAFIVAYSNGKRLPVNLVVMLEEEEEEEEEEEAE